MSNFNKDQNLVVTGTVIHGSGDGTKLGFPTANLALNTSLELPFGVYACFVKLEGREEQLPAVLHWGSRKVFSETDPKFEVHILDFEGDLYGKSITVEIRNFIRTSINFSSLTDLTTQIQKDCDKVRTLLLSD